MVKKKTFPVSKATRLQREMVVESVNGEKKQKSTHGHFRKSEKCKFPLMHMPWHARAR